MADAGRSYREAGVDIEAGDALVRRIAPAARSTRRAGVLGGIGGFGALFDPAAAGYRDPILVAATDGVGTKLRIAIDTGEFDGIGRDLVAMCVNDLICQGAEPLFFLDYFATGKLDVERASRVIEGIAAACRDAGCALVGGETAEMPGLYSGEDFDLAGFAVGALERGSELPRGVAAGDRLLGLASDGIHSNGYSLVRRIAEKSGLGWDDETPWGEGLMGRALLRPTRIYVRPVRGAMARGGVNALAHITGGGLTENLPRILPEGLGARIDLGAWALPPVFRWLREAGALADDELLTTFNAGIGMVLCVQRDAARDLAGALADAGETVVALGEIVEGSGVGYTGRLE